MPAFPNPESRNVLEPGCARCPALLEARERISWGNGPLDAEVVVVGEAPGAGDPDADRWQGGNWTGMAYTSRHSGRLIRELLSDVGFGPERCYYTNAVKCFPSDDAGSNREPTSEELETCRTHLVREIREIDPRVVISTGRHATDTIFAVEGWTLEGFLELVLEPIDLNQLGTTLLPILHPSYQAVWRSRLGYTAAEYRDALKEALKPQQEGV